MNIEQGLIDMFAVETSSLHDDTDDSVTSTAPPCCIAHMTSTKLKSYDMNIELHCTAVKKELQPNQERI